MSSESIKSGKNPFEIRGSVRLTFFFWSNRFLFRLCVDLSLDLYDFIREYPCYEIFTFGFHFVEKIPAKYRKAKRHDLRGIRLLREIHWSNSVLSRSISKSPGIVIPKLRSCFKSCHSKTIFDTGIFCVIRLAGRGAGELYDKKKGITRTAPHRGDDGC